MFRLAHPEFLYLYALLPVFILLFLYMRAWKKRSLKKFGDPEVIGRLLENVSKSKPVLKFIMLLLAYCSLVFALTQPQIGSKLEEVKRQGVDVMIALDVSNSE